jgi:hypothetical protein
MEWMARRHGAFHCLFRHGAGGPVLDVHHGRSVLFCPVCGRVFWRSRTHA